MSCTAEHSFAWDRARLLEYICYLRQFTEVGPDLWLPLLYTDITLKSKLSCSSKEVDSFVNSSAVSFISSINSSNLCSPFS